MSSSSDSFRSDSSVESPEQPMGVRSLLSIPIIRALCSSGCALAFILTAFDVVFALFCYSPIAAGGLSFSVSIIMPQLIFYNRYLHQPEQIGYSLAISGFISIFLQLFIMPTLLRTFDCATLYNFCVLSVCSAPVSIGSLSPAIKAINQTSTSSAD